MRHDSPPHSSGIFKKTKKCSFGYCFSATVKLMYRHSIRTLRWQRITDDGKLVNNSRTDTRQSSDVGHYRRWSMYLGVDPCSSRITQSLPLDDSSSFSKKEDVTVCFSVSRAAPIALTYPRSNENRRTTIGRSHKPSDRLLVRNSQLQESLVNIVEPEEVAEGFFHSAD